MDAEDDRAGWPVVPGYELHEVLGRGGFATVYRATQTSVDRPVALKVLAAAALDPATERRFRHEVRAVGALSDHPHVVALIDAGTTTTGAPFISMQLVPAGSLGDRIRAFGPMGATEVARVGAEVADALEAAHEAGILHRDIKPDNILVGRRGRAMLTDFGIATLDDGTMTVTGAVTGTLAYTAPEILKGERATAAGDVFALGATLYALAAGRAAFATGDDHQAAVMWRVANEDAPPLPPEVPYPLVELIEACMAKDPGGRPPLAEVATRLEAIAASAPVPPPESIAEDDTVDERPPLEPADPASTASTADDPTVAARRPDPPTTRQPAPTPPRPPIAPSPPPSSASSAAPSTEDAADPGATQVVGPPDAPARRRPLSGPERRMVVAAVLVALSLVAAVVLVLVLGGGDDEGSEGSGGGGEAVAATVGGAPAGVAIGPDGGAWVVNQADGTVTHVGADGEELGTTQVGSGPSGIAATDDAVWVVNTDDSTLTKLDPADGTELATNPVGDASTAVAATEDEVWVASPGDDDIARIDPESGEYQTEALTEVDYEVAHLALGGDLLWAGLTLTDGAGVVLAIDPGRATVVQRIAVDGGPSGIAVTDGGVWVGLGGSGTVAHLDGEGDLVATVDVGTDEVGRVVADGDEVWVADLDGSRVVQVDTDADEPGTSVDVGARPDAIAVADGSLWVVTTDESALRRIPL